MSPGGPLPERRRRSWSRTLTIGLAGALAFTVGAGLYLAMIAPPFQQDESSHVGYVRALQRGTVPAIDTPIPTDGASIELERALERPPPFQDREIHVANNPPFAYAAAVPFTTFSSKVGIRSGELFGFRLFSVASAAGAVALTVLAGRELAGGDGFAGLVAGGLVASTLSVSVVSALAALDGPGLLVTTGVTWALARYARTKELPDALHLGLWCAAASAVRPMALAFGAVAGLLAVLIHIRSWRGRSLGSVLVRLGGPTVVLTGWFYALNFHRYGDPTGSRALFEKLGREPSGSIWSFLGSTAPFVNTLDYLITDVYGRDPWWGPAGVDRWAVTVGAVGLLGAALVVARRSGRPEVLATGRPRLCLVSWLAVSVLFAVPMVLVAKHLSGGGGGHARYLLPVLPILAAAVAVVVTRIGRWLGVGAVAVMAAFHLQRIRAAGHLRLGPGSDLYGPELAAPIMGSGPRIAALALMLAGVVTLVGALGASAWGARQASPRRA